MTDLPVQLVRLTKRIACLEKKVRDDEIGQYSARSLKEYFEDEISDVVDDLGKFSGRTINSLIEHDKQLKNIEKKLSSLYIIVEELSHRIKDIQFAHFGKNFCGNCIHHIIIDDLPCCDLTEEICDHDDASCSMYQDSYVDTDSTTKEVRIAAKAKLNSLYGKPDREECKHCPKSQCDNCMNFPF